MRCVRTFEGMGILLAWLSRIAGASGLVACPYRDHSRAILLRASMMNDANIAKLRTNADVCFQGRYYELTSVGA